MPEKTNKERLKDITDSIETGIRELFQSDKYKQYLQTMSRFHRYSVNNTMLIYMQKPDASLVAGFNKWQDKFGRHVKRGETGITIIAPTPFKKKIETEKLDPDTKLPQLDAEGKVILEEKEVRIPMFKPVKVFDVSQTAGKPLPKLASDLTGVVKNFDVFMEALRRSSPVPIQTKPLLPGMDGYFSLQDQQIVIRKGMSEVQTVSAAVHEIAHAKLHNPKTALPREQWKISMVSEGGTKHDYLTGFSSEREAREAALQSGWRHVDENYFVWRLEVERDSSSVPQTERDRYTEEVQAESVSFAVCAYYGIATDENSFGYIASWSKDKELPELKASLELINSASSELIMDIDRNYAAICRERGLDGPELKENDYETTFFNNPDDSFLIYQLTDDSRAAGIRFMGADYMESNGLEITKANYVPIYTGSLETGGGTNSRLDHLFEAFNLSKPDDFTGHSLSVSDVLVLKQNGTVTSHYVDSVGFKELPDFMPPDNYLKTAEMTVEDDYGMIDGIINNGPREPQAEPVRENAAIPKEQKPSLREKLRQPIPERTLNTAPAIRAEKEI